MSHLKLSTNKANRYDREHDVGISMIKDKLNRADRRITSVKAGQKLADYLTREDEEKVCLENRTSLIGSK